MDQNQEIFARYMNDKDFQQLVAEYLRKQVYDQIRSAADRCSAVQPVLDARVLPFILSWLTPSETPVRSLRGTLRVLPLSRNLFQTEALYRSHRGSPAWRDGLDRKPRGGVRLLQPAQRSEYRRPRSSNRRSVAIISSKK